MSTYSCGCTTTGPIDGSDIYILGEDCDAVEGFHPSLSYHYMCQTCADKFVREGWGTRNKKEAEAAFKKAVDAWANNRDD